MDFMAVYGEAGMIGVVGVMFVYLVISLSKKSEAQQQAAGIAYAAKKGEIPVSKLKGASKQMYKMTKKQLKHKASTKHKGLPKKKT